MTILQGKLNELRKAKKAHCEGKTTKRELNKLTSEYIKAKVDSAVIKAPKSATRSDVAYLKKKAKSEGEKIATRIINGKCSVSVSGTGKKKDSGKKSTSTRKRKTTTLKKKK